MPNPKCDQNQDKVFNLDIKVHVNAVNYVLWPHTNAGRDDYYMWSMAAFDKRE